MITFTQPDNTVLYPPGTTVTFGGTLGPPIRCILRQAMGPDILIPVPAGLVANWKFDVTFPATPGTYTYEVEAAGSKDAVRTFVVAQPTPVPTALPESQSQAAS